MVYRTLLKAIQKNVKLAALRLRQSVFCINAKTCIIRYLNEVLQTKQTQRIITSVPDRSLFLFPHPRTLYLVVWRWGEGVAELEPGKFLAQRGSASLGVVPTVNKKTQINSRTYSFLSKLTYMLINIDPQPNIKPPERLTYTLKNTTHSRVSSLLNGYSTRR